MSCQLKNKGKHTFKVTTSHFTNWQLPHCHMLLLWAFLLLLTT